MAHSIFGSVVEGLIPESRFSFKAHIAKDIGIPKSTFSNWIHGRHAPKYLEILAIAQRLNNGNSKRYREIVFMLVDALALDEMERQESK